MKPTAAPKKLERTWASASNATAITAIDAVANALATDQRSVRLCGDGRPRLCAVCSCALNDGLSSLNLVPPPRQLPLS
jgi:hypothetical protein